MEISENKPVNKLIDKYMKLGKWKVLANLLKKELVNEPDNYWFCINYAIALYNLGFKETALEYSSKAIVIENKDPFILYHHGIILYLNKKFREAISNWNIILKMSSNYLGFGKFGGGKRWASLIKNDATYYVGLAYFYLNDLDNAIKYYRLHLENRKRGIPSFVTKKQVEEELFEMISLKKYG